MILIIGGTSEACEIAKLLGYKGRDYIMSVATGAGMEMAKTQGVKAVMKRFSLQSLTQYLNHHHVRCVVDASHPHATEVSIIAMKACDNSHVAYMRFERPQADLKPTSHLHLVDTMADARMLAVQLGHVVLVTGSKHVDEWLNIDHTRVIFRVLPRADVLRGLEDRGIVMDDIIAVKGPFSYAANRAVIEDYKIEVFVMKESGTASNTQEKLMAAKDAGIHCIVVKRPVITYPIYKQSLQALFDLLEEYV